MYSSEDEFPGLSALGLYAAETDGDGNCLFNALSDQLYGNQNEHRQIRATVIDHMREQSSYYKAYIDVHPGGGTRRNPKRKNAGAYSTPISATPPTPQEIERAFDNHLTRMAQGGTYGDNMEIVAFATAFNSDVRIYQRDFAYMVSPIQNLVSETKSDGRSTLHIAYHTWEHYSTIRNLDGPHTGLPHVRVKALTLAEEEAQRLKIAQTPLVQPWKIDVVMRSLPFLLDRTAVKKTLDEMGGDVNKAVNKLLDAEDGGFTSSAQESSSVEREPDSDDDAVYGPNKRQDRRMSKATRALMKDKAEYRREAFAKIEQNDGSQESIASSNGSQGWEDLPELEPPQPRRRKDEDEDSDWRPEVEPLTDDDRGSAPPPTADQKIRIKMNFSTLPPPSSGPQKSHLRQQGPQSRRLPARQRKELKKQAQKTARKKRAQADAQANGLIPQQKTELPMHFKNAVEGLKTIHI